MADPTCRLPPSPPCGGRGRISGVAPEGPLASHRGERDQGEGGSRHVRRNRLLLSRARMLRVNQTEMERKLWGALRAKRLAGLKFARQRPVGPYIADFLCADARLIVELDGDQHGGDGVIRDARRTAVLETFGYRVIRFWNFEVQDNFDGVLEGILVAAKESDRRLPSILAYERREKSGAVRNGDAS